MGSGDSISVKPVAVSLDEALEDSHELSGRGQPRVNGEEIMLLPLKPPHLHRIPHHPQPRRVVRRAVVEDVVVADHHKCWHELHRFHP